MYTAEHDVEHGADLMTAMLHLLRHRRLVLGGAIALGALSLAGLQLAPDQYEARATFAPSGITTPDLGSLGSLALSLGGLTGGQSGPKFYADLATSDAILLRVLADTVRMRSPDGKTVPVTYIKAQGITGDDSLSLRDAALRHLRRHIDVDFDARTSVVGIGVESTDPELSVSTARAILDALNEFNIETFQATAKAKRDFLERSLAQAKAELSESEAQLRAFYYANKQFQQSPSLVFREAELRQTYELRKQNVTTLLTSFEQARLDQVRDTPVLTILDEPILPSRPTGPKRFLLSLGLAMIWVAGTVVYLTGQLAFRHLARLRPTEAEQFRREIGAIGSRFALGTSKRRTEE